MQTQIFKNIPDISKLADPAIFNNAIAAAKELVEINGRLMEKYLENPLKAVKSSYTPLAM
ncbi:MAG: Phasin 2 protein [Gammaproteobacteria bacterium]|nr:Phasin 2 protein [Gammaproteobacteria bacterium]